MSFSLSQMGIFPDGAAGDPELAALSSVDRRTQKIDPDAAQTKCLAGASIKPPNKTLREALRAQ